MCIYTSAPNTERFVWLGRHNCLEVQLTSIAIIVNIMCVEVLGPRTIFAVIEIFLDCFPPVNCCLQSKSTIQSGPSPAPQAPLTKLGTRNLWLATLCFLEIFASNTQVNCWTSHEAVWFLGGGGLTLKDKRTSKREDLLPTLPFPQEWELQKSVAHPALIHFHQGLPPHSLRCLAVRTVHHLFF